MIKGNSPSKSPRPSSLNTEDDNNKSVVSGGNGGSGGAAVAESEETSTTSEAPVLESKTVPQHLQSSPKRKIPAQLEWEGLPTEKLWPQTVQPKKIENDDNQSNNAKNNGDSLNKSNTSDWPEGWIKRIYIRSTGKTKGDKDRYWYSPAGRRFRSLAEVRKYMDLLKKHDGNETTAYTEFKTPKKRLPEEAIRLSETISPQLPSTASATENSKSSETGPKLSSSFQPSFSSTPALLPTRSTPATSSQTRITPEKGTEALQGLSSPVISAIHHTQNNSHHKDNNNTIDLTSKTVEQASLASAETMVTSHNRDGNSDSASSLTLRRLPLNEQNETASTAVASMSGESLPLLPSSGTSRGSTKDSGRDSTHETNDTSTSNGDRIAGGNENRNDNTGSDDNNSKSLDCIATDGEEEYVMRRPLQNIDTAEEIQHNTQEHPSQPTTAVTSTTVVSTTFTDGRESDTTANTRGIGTAWKTLSISVPSRRDLIWGKRPKKKRKKRTGYRVEGLNVVRHKMQHSLPKWIPSESGRYSNKEEDLSSLVFTRPQFVEKVVIEAEERIRNLQPEHQTVTITISEHHPRDPHSYLLEAEGTEEALNIVTNLAQRFVRNKIERLNLQWLVDDGASLVVDVKLTIEPEDDPIDVLGVRFSSAKATPAEGVYIRSMAKGALSKTLGGIEAFHSGCVVLAINNNEVSSYSKVKNLLMQVKSTCVDTQTPTRIKLSLCLSKYADLSKVKNLSKLMLRRMDGLPYNEKDYESFRFERYIEWTQKQKTNQVESKARALQQNRNKRKKQMQESYRIDNESDIDTASFAVMDSESEEEKPRRKRKKVASDNDNKKSKAHVSGYNIFRVFEEKVKPLVLLDYKDTKINIKSICSSMWKRHKEILGDNPHRKCLNYLPEMVEDVIKDHVENQRSRGIAFSSTEEDLEKLTCGISKHFVPKFISLLQKEYPRETETQLVSRLVGMWELHRKNRLYGIRCKANCSCLGEWDQVFGKGDKSAAKEFLTIKRRPSLLSNSTASSNDKKVPKASAVPRKKRAIEQSSDVSKRKSKKPKASTSFLSSRMEPFEVQFNTSLPLGAYFRTRKNQCQVFSIFLNGQIANEKRITNGTTVVSVNKTGGNRFAISSHEMLERLYSDARRTKSTMFISFKNQGVKPGIVSANRINTGAWNNVGEWIGPDNLDENDGWAGGARMASRQNLPQTSATRQLPKVNSMKSLLNRMASGTNISASAQNTQKEFIPSEHMHIVTNMERKENTSSHNVPQWTTIVNTEAPGHNVRTPKKILLSKKSSFPPEKEESGLNRLLPSSKRRSRRERTHSKSVRISLSNNEEIFFFKDDAPNVHQVMQLDPNPIPNKIIQELPPDQALIDAFRNKSCNDVIDILAAEEFLTAQSNGEFDLEAVLQKEYDFVKSELEKIDDSNKEKKNDIGAKITIAKIYINCVHLIQKTMSLKKWYELTIELKFIDINQNLSLVDAIGGNVSLKLDDGKVKESYDSLPVKRFAQRIIYKGDNIIYTMHNNKSFPFEKRNLDIDLKSGSLTESNATGRKLGTFRLELNDIEDRCLPNEVMTEYMQPLSDEFVQEISDGFITTNVKKKSADKEYVRIKKQEIIKKLKQQLEFIERFNQHPSTPSGARLTANISGLNGVSILHAAIVLLDDKELVQKMLKLGANPRSSIDTGIGTPLNVAQRNYHNALEKEKNHRRRMEEKKDSNMGIEPLVQRCNQAMMLVEMLQENVIEAPVATSESNETHLSPNQPLQQPPSRSSLISSVHNTTPLSHETHTMQNQMHQTHFEGLSSTSSANDNSVMPHDMYATLNQQHHQPVQSVHNNPPLLHETHAMQNQPHQTHIDLHDIYDTLNQLQQQSVQSVHNNPPLLHETHSMQNQPHQTHFEGLPPLPHAYNSAPNSHGMYASLEHSCSLAPLPTMKRRDWVHLGKRKRCSTPGPQCRFFQNGDCKYWHDLPAPLGKQNQPFPYSDANLPQFPKEKVEFKKQSAPDKREWWTAAYVYKPRKVVIYVQHFQNSPGRVGREGLVWFRKKKDALYGLRCTVHLYNIRLQGS